MAPVSLATARLRLRAFKEDDFGWLHPIASNLAVTQFTDWGPNTAEDTEEFLRGAVTMGGDPNGFLWAATLQDGTGIGSAGLTRVSVRDRRASFGYMLDPAHWGRGYATEVAVAVRDFAFDKLGVHRLEATCHPDNSASARVLAKAGLQLEGHMRDHLLMRGAWRDSLLYAVLDSDPRLHPA